MLKFAFLGAWHSHASMHVREVAGRPNEFQLLGVYDADSEVVERNLQKWREYGLDILIFDSVDDVLNSEAEAVVVEGHVYENLDYVERALNAGKHVLMEKPAGVDLVGLEQVHAAYITCAPGSSDVVMAGETRAHFFLLCYFVLNSVCFWWAAPPVTQFQLSWDVT